MLAGKIYTCVYNSIGTPFWQLMNPESQITSNLFGVTAYVPSEYPTIDDAYSAYRRTWASQNFSTQATFTINMDAP